MPHYVTGFITATDFIHPICSNYPALRAIPLKQGFSLFPLTSEIAKNLGITQSINFVDSGELLNELTDLLAKISLICPLLCFETEYFGGEGSQFAAVFENGKIVFGPAIANIGPINEGLHLLGVKAKNNEDEFDTIGLGQHRSTNNWLRKLSE